MAPAAAQIRAPGRPVPRGQMAVGSGAMVMAQLGNHISRVVSIGALRATKAVQEDRPGDVEPREASRGFFSDVGQGHAACRDVLYLHGVDEYAQIGGQRIEGGAGERGQRIG